MGVIRDEESTLIPSIMRSQSSQFAIDEHTLIYNDLKKNRDTPHPIIKSKLSGEGLVALLGSNSVNRKRSKLFKKEGWAREIAIIEYGKVLTSESTELLLDQNESTMRETENVGDQWSKCCTIVKSSSRKKGEVHIAQKLSYICLYFLSDNQSST
ncbi:hypothetical protein CROQUDRAFT_130853 [Cronartium quercuum f. sp. fusiforme G11]|uniref:Uncharacterized protein n=1 Tax=Cronartium quercuum f. sp. fusiforme G11 TaxID=708437 RepID=A0A9P6NTG9_9BASI|nr:hypothetical protein CROQUDRAFT_130853 [Cronartium quercuum f. sp. fusiforme G11]